MIRRRALLLVLLLSGCATLPVPPCPTADCQATAVADWKLHGRISLTRGEQGWHAGLDWENHADRYRLLVSGPLGQGALQLSGDPRGVTLVDSNGRVHSAPDAEQLLLAVSGWQLPVSGLRFWVLGLPDPHMPHRQTLDAQGRVEQLEQSGWTIHYTRYREFDGRVWPDRLTLERDDLVLKLVIDQWQLAAAEPAP